MFVFRMYVEPAAPRPCYSVNVNIRTTAIPRAQSLLAVTCRLPAPAEPWSLSRPDATVMAGFSSGCSLLRSLLSAKIHPAKKRQPGTVMYQPMQRSVVKESSKEWSTREIWDLLADLPKCGNGRERYCTTAFRCFVICSPRIAFTCT